MSPMKKRVPASEYSQSVRVCAPAIYRHVRVACFIASPEMSVYAAIVYGAAPSDVLQG
jgi:hypothetical protein